MMNANRIKMGLAKGWVLTEAVVAVALLGLLLGGLATIQSSTAALNDTYMNQQRCLSAATAMLDSLAATGRPLSADDCQRLWPNVTASVEQAAGQGDWAGLTLVKVVTTAEDRGRQVRMEQNRYMAMPEGRP
jgi:Tfp pilus assembly protein PilV